MIAVYRGNIYKLKKPKDGSLKTLDDVVNYYGSRESKEKLLGAAKIIGDENKAEHAL